MTIDCKEFEHIAGTLPDLFYVFDLIENRNIYVNQGIVAVLGYSAEQIKHMDNQLLETLIHPEDLANINEINQRYNNFVPGEMIEHEYRVLHADGSYRLLRSRDVVMEYAVDGRAWKVVGYAQDITERRRAELALKELSTRLLNLQDEERRRISREMHDGTSQNLVAIKLNLHRLKQLTVTLRPEVTRLIEDTQILTDQALQELRTLSYVMHPPILNQGGLGYALQWYVKGFTQRSGIKVGISVADNIGALPDDVETTLYRIVQEGLTNIYRHTESSNAQITLKGDDQFVHLELKDSGKGIKFKEEGDTLEDIQSLGVGIAGMKQRIRQLNGKFCLQSEETGTVITAIIPTQQNMAQLSY